MGFLHGTAEVIKECRRTGRPFWFIDHAYFRRGYEKGNFRVVRSGIHKNTVSGDSRFHVKTLRWKSRGADILLIPPPPMIAFVFDLDGWVDRTIAELKRHTDRRIVVKNKQDGPLVDYLKSAWALVSFASVADVEAACYGVPVFSSPFSPAYPVAETKLSQIESPVFSDRTAWAASLTCGQFHVYELATGQAWSILNGLDNVCGTENSGRELAKPQ